MAHGPKVCSACGDDEGIEEHHLYFKSEGCPDDLTVWLCNRCHGSTHEMRRRLNISERTKAGLKAAKARGVKLGGGPEGIAALQAYIREHGNGHAVAAVKAGADDFADRMSGVIELAEMEGAKSLEQIAEWLNKYDVPTRRGGKWHSSTVNNAKKRNYRWHKTSVSRIKSRNERSDP